MKHANESVFVLVPCRLPASDATNVDIEALFPYVCLVQTLAVCFVVWFLYLNLKKITFEK